MTRYAMFIDIHKCNGCYNCFLACRDEHYNNDYPPLSAAQPLNGQFWMQIKEIERGAYPRPKLSYIPLPCLQCREAPCMDAAENGAVYRREDGIVVIDPQKAKGQEAIVHACPYRVIFWNPALQLPQKCTFCAHRLDQGEKQPRCVESCPTGALIFGDLDDAASDIAQMAASADLEDFHPEFATAPVVRHIGIPKRLVAGEVVLADKQGECVQGAIVTLEGDGVKLETRSDEFGDFEFEGLARNAAYRLTVSVEGYAARQQQVVTRKDVDLGEIVMSPN